jgi:hypothetical protein
MIRFRAAGPEVSVTHDAHPSIGAIRGDSGTGAYTRVSSSRAEKETELLRGFGFFGFSGFFGFFGFFGVVRVDPHLCSARLILGGRLGVFAGRFEVQQDELGRCR